MNSSRAHSSRSVGGAGRPDFGGRLLVGLEGAALSAHDRRRLAHPAVGGGILFARNFESARQLRRLCADIRRAARPRRVVIAADHEGGRVQRFGAPDFTPLPPMRDLPSAAAAADCGLVAAAELVAAGLDLSFAPVADLDLGHSAVIGDRAFAADPAVAADRIRAFAAGAHRGGMQCCAKHFPGHGGVAADSHAELPTDARPLADLRAADLVPFAQWANAGPANGAASVMTAHVVYPDADPRPATYSAFWLKTMLREELNFAGVVVGDDLCMNGARLDNDGAPDGKDDDMGARMVDALQAGCDALLICEPDMIDEALDFAGSGNANSDSPWLQLAARPDGRITVDDAEYEEARAGILRQWR